MKLYILKNFCNYYNRRLRRFSSLSDYRDFSTYTVSNANFNYGDGIMTSHVVGAISAYKGDGDYMVLTDDSNKIVSRWFVLENNYIRGGQCEILLRRDVVADFLDEIISAPCFIEKATIQNVSDTAIYNKEPGMTYNQIKTDEVELKDKSGIPWLVGYYMRDTGGESATPITISAGLNAAYTQADFTVASKNDLAYAAYSSSNPLKVLDKVKIALNTMYGDTSENTNYYAELTSNSYNAYASYEENTNFNSYYTTPAYTADENEEAWIAAVAANRGLLLSDANNYIGNTGAMDILASLKADNGKLVYFTDTGKYARISFRSITGNTYAGQYIQSSSLQTRLQTIAEYSMNLTKQAGDWSYSRWSQTFRIASGAYTEYIPVFTEISSVYDPTGTSWKATDVVITSDAPYNIFCIPYGEINVIQSNGSTVRTKKDEAMNMMSSIIQKYSGGTPVLLDAQIVPFCPAQDYVSATNTIDLRKLPNNAYSIFNANEDATEIGFIFHCPYSQFSNTLSYSIDVDIRDTEYFKIEHETTFYRLVSPNWDGQFEFSATANGGVAYFNIDCAFKPYQPYIHVAPQFGGLYGRRKADAIGLICGGDFGLSMVSDAFATYERQNANYQRIFDRQVQNLEVGQEMEKTEAIVNAITGTFTSAGTGAAAGAVVGGLPGAIIGGISGGLASGVGGIADLAMLDKAHKEASGFQKDMFTYQMGNIRALPLNLSKVTSLNPNNHLFVILEKYECSETEVDALRAKLRYTGMTVGRIDTINTFINYGPQFIQGKLITIDGIEDAHLAYAIGQELSQGVYMQIGEGYNGYDPI